MNRIIALGCVLLFAGCATQQEWTSLNPKERYLIQHDKNTKIWIYDDGGYTTLYCLRGNKPTFAAHINSNDIYSAYFVGTDEDAYSTDEGPLRGYAQELMGSNYSSRCIIDLPDGSIIITDDNGDGLADTKTEQRGLDVYHSTIETIVTTNSVTKANPAL